MNSITNKDDLLMIQINKYFYNNLNINYMLPIINGESDISLRIIDWFVTNYSKKKNISYYNNKELFNVYISYKKQLKAYSKKQFDPFCRRSRINYNYNGNDYLETTVGQLNFFKWAIKNKIIEYITNNLSSIERDMTKSLKLSVEKKKVCNKRHELSRSATKKINKHNIKITITF